MSTEKKVENSISEDVATSSLVLREALEKLPIRGHWKFGPFQFWLRTTASQFTVDWEKASEEPAIGDFVDQQGASWKYHDFYWEPGQYGGTVNALWLLQTDPQDSTKIKRFISLSYNVGLEGSLCFSASIPDPFGHPVSLTSPLFPTPAFSTWLKVDSLPESQEYVYENGKFVLAGNLLGFGAKPFSPQPTLPPAAVERWLTMAHLRDPDQAHQYPDVLQAFNLDHIPPGSLGFLAPTSLNPQVGNETLHSLALDIASGPIRLRENFDPFAPEHLFYATPEKTGETEPRLDISLGLTVLIHPETHWLVPAGNLDLEKTQVLVTQGPQSISAAINRASITQTVLSLVGNTSEQITLAHNGNQDLNLNSSEVSISPAFITGGFVDMLSPQPSLLVAGIIFVANPDRLTFSWSGGEKAKASSPARPIPLDQLKDPKMLQSFDLIGRAVLSQNLSLASHMHPAIVKQLMSEEEFRLEESS